MTNCPNCGAVIEPYKCKCDYCGTWYFDFTVFYMSCDDPYYVKFRTPHGVITTLAKPELRTIEVTPETIYASCSDKYVASFIRSYSCDLDVIFHSVVDRDGRLYTVEVDKEM